MRYDVLVGLNYPTDLDVIDALCNLGQQATAAQLLALDTRDPRDVDAARVAEEARQLAVQEAFEHGLLKRAEPGDVVDDLPVQSIPWLLEQGQIREHAEAPTAHEWADLGRREE